MNKVSRVLCVIAALVACALAIAPRSVNLALQTSVLFEPKDYRKHLKFINGVRRVLDKLELALLPRKNALRTDINQSNLFTEVLRAISKYDEEELKLFFKALNSVMQNYFYKGSVFREIIYDPKLQMYIRNKLKKWANADSSKMKAKLIKYLKSGVKKNTTLNRLGMFLNDFIASGNEAKMLEIVEKLRQPQHEIDLESVIKDGLESIIFEHYDKMNYTSRVKLADEINKLNDKFKDPYSDVDRDLKLTFRRSANGSTEQLELENEGVKEILDDKGNGKLILNKDLEIFVKAFDASLENKEATTGKQDVNSEKKNDISLDNDNFIRHTLDSP